MFDFTNFMKILILTISMLLVTTLFFTTDQVLAQISNTTSTTTTPIPDQVASEVAEETPIAGDGDVEALGAGTNTTIATVGGGLASGIIATFLKNRNKDEKIDQALKEKDRLIDDIYDCLFMVINEALEPANKGKPFDEVIQQKAYPDNNSDTRTIANVINERRLAFKQWYKTRYLENPE